MKKSVKIVCVILAALLLIGIGLLVTIHILLKNIGLGASVSDYESRIEIWENAAGNSSRSKLEDMNIDKNSNALLSTIAFASAIVGEQYVDAERTLDTFTYQYEIKGGYEKETYEDIPYLIPYIVEDSRGAVIVIPGGGYGYKSMDGADYEGKDVALALNEKGYSAFVLHYRSNPYEYPIPQLDVQRAVRFLRFHAAEYGIDPEHISLVGFSAGGYQVGSYINLIMGTDLFPEDYTPDKIDAVDDSVQAAGMIYPALTYRYNIPMLFCTFDANDVRDENKREELLNMTDLSLHIHSVAVPQFVSYGTKDGMVGMDGAKDYIAAAKNAGADVTEHIAEGQDHGYHTEHYIDDFAVFLNIQFAKVAR